MPDINIAILGCGNMAGAHAMRMRSRQGVRIVALCDVNDQIVKGFIDNHLAQEELRPAVFTDRAAMYEKAKPDAVIICTPHTQHFDHCMEALERGCHVLVEKPMVTSAADARGLEQKVNETGKVLTVGYNTPCTPEFNYLREQIRSKNFGNLELVSGHVVQNWMAFTAGSWRQDPKLSGGGQAYDTGAHLLNSICWSVESNVAAVHAFLDNHGTPVDVNASINIRFENGVLATVVIGGNCAASGSHLTYAFERGKVYIDGWGGSWIEVFDADGPVKYPPIEGQTEFPDDNFIDAIAGRAEPRTTARNGVIQSELMDAIYESARTGQTARPPREG
jgi:predicted dehydrogenase